MIITFLISLRNGILQSPSGGHFKKFYKKKAAGAAFLEFSEQLVD
jgi:hypothetical protein